MRLRQRLMQERAGMNATMATIAYMGDVGSDETESASSASLGFFESAMNADDGHLGGVMVAIGSSNRACSGPVPFFFSSGMKCLKSEFRDTIERRCLKIKILL